MAQTAAREIGQIFAQMIDYRKANKDKIEDFIIQTELAAIDPRILRLRQEEINKIRGQLGEFDKIIGDLLEKKTGAIADANDAWIRATGQVASQATTAEGRVKAASLAAQSDVAVARIKAVADLNVAKERSASDKEIAQLKANAEVYKELERAESEGRSGSEAKITKAIELGQSSSASDTAGFELLADNLWSNEFDSKFRALQGNEPAQRALIGVFKTALDTMLEYSPNKDAIKADFAVSNQGLDLIAGRSSEQPNLAMEDRATALAETAIKLGFSEKDYRPALSALPKVGVGVSGGASITARGPSSAPIYAQLGLNKEEDLEPFIKRAAYNNYFLDQSLAGKPTSEIVSYESFIADTDKPNSEASKYTTRLRNANASDLSAYGDDQYIRLLLQKRGLTDEYNQLQDAQKGAIINAPTSQSINRRTLEAYSEIYGSPDQQRLVRLSEFGRANPVSIDVYRDKETGKEVIDVPELEALTPSPVGTRGGGIRNITGPEEVPVVAPGSSAKFDPARYEKIGTREVQLDAPELELLLSDVAAKRKESQNKFGFGLRAEGLDQKLTGTGANVKSSGSATLSTPKPVPQRIEPEPEQPIDLSLDYQNPRTATLNRPPNIVEKQTDTQVGKEVIPGEQPGQELTNEEKMISFIDQGVGNTEFLNNLNDDQLGSLAKKLTEYSTQLATQYATAEETEKQTIKDQINAAAAFGRKIVANHSGNKLTEEDFESGLSEDELIQKAGIKRAKPNLSADQIKEVEEMSLYARGESAASKAAQQSLKTGTKSPEQFVKGAKEIDKDKLAQIRKLAQTPGSISAYELDKAIKAILGKEASKQQIDAAKSIYLAITRLGND